MEVTFNLSIGYVNSDQEETFDTLEDFGLSDEEWKALSQKDKDELIIDWSWNHIELWIDED